MFIHRLLLLSLLVKRHPIESRFGTTDNDTADNFNGNKRYGDYAENYQCTFHIFGYTILNDMP